MMSTMTRTMIVVETKERGSCLSSAHVIYVLCLFSRAPPPPHPPISQTLNLRRRSTLRYHRKLSWCPSYSAWHTMEKDSPQQISESLQLLPTSLLVLASFHPGLSDDYAIIPKLANSPSGSKYFPNVLPHTLELQAQQYLLTFLGPYGFIPIPSRRFEKIDHSKSMDYERQHLFQLSRRTLYGIHVEDTDSLVSSNMQLQEMVWLRRSTDSFIFRDNLDSILHSLKVASSILHHKEANNMVSNKVSPTADLPNRPLLNKLKHTKIFCGLSSKRKTCTI